MSSRGEDIPFYANWPLHGSDQSPPRPAQASSLNPWSCQAPWHLGDILEGLEVFSRCFRIDSGICRYGLFEGDNQNIANHPSWLHRRATSVRSPERFHFRRTFQGCSMFQQAHSCSKEHSFRLSNNPVNSLSSQSGNGVRFLTDVGPRRVSQAFVRHILDLAAP